MAPQTVWIVYGSPAGSTRQVAETIAAEAEKQAGRVVLVDFFEAGEGVDRLYADIRAGDLLFVGSPVYAGHPLPAVMTFISGLPVIDNVGAAFFVTYGMVSSGLALYDMARQVTAKGMTVLGGIKVPAVHSMLWHEQNPLGEGRPDAADLAEVSLFTREVLKKSVNADPRTLPSETFNYQRQEVQDRVAESGLHVLTSLMLPLDVNEAVCTMCGLCVENCPTGNIRLDDSTPALGDNCILCFNCVRFCDPGAITSKILPFIGGEIQKRLAFFKEPAEVKIFI